MHDIRLAIGLIGFVSVAIFSLSFRALRGRPIWVLDLAAASVGLLMTAYAYLVWGQLWIVKWIPLPSVLVLSNWFPLMLAALAAVAWHRIGPAGIGRRTIMMTAVIGAAAYSVFYFVPMRPPACQDEWAEPVPPLVWPVCLQTTPSTCSAAAAATILRTLDISTNEQEMAELCLTRSGTTWLGLYHGLSTKLLLTKFDVEFFESDVDGLAEMTEFGPLLLCCQLSHEVAEQEPEYALDGGWIPGAAHSVVYFGGVGDLHIIGDPSRGYEQWSRRDLQILWTGTGLRITRDESETDDEEADTKTAAEKHCLERPAA